MASTTSPPIGQRAHDRAPKLHWHRASRHWVVVYYDPETERRCWRSTRTADLEEAQAFLESHRDRLGSARRGHETLETGDQARVTIARILDLVLEDYLLEGRRAARTMACTIKPIRHELGAHRVATLTLADLHTARRRWRSLGYSPGYINRFMSALQRACTLAVELKVIARMPPFRWPRFDERDAVRHGVITPEELMACNAAEPWQGARDRAEWAYWTGMRFGEITGLTWAGFDPHTWTLMLPNRGTKSRQGRPFRLPPGPYREIIARRWAARIPSCPFIFHHEGRAMPDWKRWGRAWEAAGLPMRKTKHGHQRPAKIFADLRRTGIRNLIQAGVPEKVAMLVSGHRTRSVFERYHIVEEADITTALARVADHVGALPPVIARRRAESQPHAAGDSPATRAGRSGQPGRSVA
jgi:integrase